MDLGIYLSMIFTRFVYFYRFTSTNEFLSILFTSRIYNSFWRALSILFTVIAILTSVVDETRIASTFNKCVFCFQSAFVSDFLCNTQFTSPTEMYSKCRFSFFSESVVYNPPNDVSIATYTQHTHCCLCVDVLTQCFSQNELNCCAFGLVHVYYFSWCFGSTVKFYRFSHKFLKNGSQPNGSSIAHCLIVIRFFCLTWLNDAIRFTNKTLIQPSVLLLLFSLAIDMHIPVTVVPNLVDTKEMCVSIFGGRRWVANGSSFFYEYSLFSFTFFSRYCLDIDISFSCVYKRPIVNRIFVTSAFQSYWFSYSNLSTWSSLISSLFPSPDLVYFSFALNYFLIFAQVWNYHYSMFILINFLHSHFIWKEIHLSMPMVWRFT